MFTDTMKSKSGIATSQQNTIANGTIFTGDLESSGDFRIEGTVIGNLRTSAKVVIGKTGSIQGSLICQNADVEGKFSGNLEVQETLTLRSTSNLEGEVEIGKLAVEPGASFNASCGMKGSVKELNNNSQKTSTIAEKEQSA
jgi:cytoskeletal protein CcmA (bactofilin family)